MRTKSSFVVLTLLVTSLFLFGCITGSAVEKTNNYAPDEQAINQQSSSLQQYCTKISDLLQNSECDGAAVLLIGNVSDVKFKTSQRGNDYTTFELVDEQKQRITVFAFIGNSPPLKEREKVSVLGAFHKTRIVSGYSFFNQIEAHDVRIMDGLKSLVEPSGNQILSCMKSEMEFLTDYERLSISKYCSFISILLFDPARCDNKKIQIEGYPFDIYSEDDIYLRRSHTTFMLFDKNGNALRVITYDDPIVKKGEKIKIEGMFYSNKTIGVCRLTNFIRAIQFYS